MTTKTQFNPKRDLPYLAALAQTAQFALAGSVLLGPRGWFFGGLLGALISVTMAYASSQYDTIAKTRRPFVLAGMILLGVFSPVIIGTSMFLDLPQSINEIWRGIVGAVWGILPDASVALTGFVAGKGMVKQDDKQDEQPPMRKKAEPKQALALSEQPRPLYSCSQCEWTSVEAEQSGKNAEKALSGHMLKHRKIELDTTLLINKDSAK